LKSILNFFSSIYFKLLILIVSVVFISFKIIEIYQTQFDVFSSVNVLENKTLQNLIFLFLIFNLLMPFNWFFETAKWKILLKSERINIPFFAALKSVLSGVMMGFYTPARIGEIPGRILFLDNINKENIITPSIVSSIINSLITFVLGLFSSIIYLIYYPLPFDNTNWLWYLLVFPIIGLLFYVFKNQLKKYSSHLKNLKFHPEYLNAFLLGLVRYFIFTIQFYIAFLICGVDISFFQSIIIIPIIFLFISFFPGFLLVQLGVRTSAAVFFVSSFDNNYNAIILASLMVWSFNILLPSIFALFFNGKSIIQALR
jgi:hypothetical protein